MLEDPVPSGTQRANLATQAAARENSEAILALPVPMFLEQPNYIMEEEYYIKKKNKLEKDGWDEERRIISPKVYRISY